MNLRPPSPSGQTHLERAEQRLVDRHHCAGVVELSAVVPGPRNQYELSWKPTTERGDARRGKEGYELPLSKEFVAVLDDLVRSTNEVHIVLL